MLQELEAIGRRSIDKLLYKRREDERIVGERTNAFFDFMRAAGINVGELRQEVVAGWLGNSREALLKITEQSLDLTTALHSTYLWSDTQIRFELSTENEGRKPLVAHVKQDVAARGDLFLDFSGVIAGISQIWSVESRNGPSISFRDRNGLGFDLAPGVGGIVFNFIGDQPRT